MPELNRLEWARMNLDQVRRQLLDAARTGWSLTPEQLENAAGNIAEGMRVYIEETGGAPPMLATRGRDLSVCSRPRRHRR